LPMFPTRAKTNSSPASNVAPCNSKA
jgi:hypothetical protein